ncbi:MAG: universal stress protein [Bacteroidales bacterium]|nr:universal stress protein [Bacteroidales bacterium]
MTTAKPIIVPWDYSEKAEFAVLHAINISKCTLSPIILVHITKRETDNKEHTEKLSAMARNIANKHGVTVSCMVRTGNIFTEISKIIDETDAMIAIMGTHGMKGLQKLTGSWALKVISGSKAPFIVVQDRPQPDADTTKIVLPMDFKLEEREKLVWTKFIATIYKCKFYICYTETGDEIIQKRTIGNIKAACAYLESNGINYELHQLPGDEGVTKETLSFAQHIDSSMIIIMTTKNIKFQDYVLGASEQQIIANASKIAVMCVNPKTGVK